MKLQNSLPNLRDNRGHARQRGITIIMVALSIFLLMAMAALAVDVGILYTARTSAQHAADAAALAGAFTFTMVSEPQPSSATNAAMAMAAKNAVMGTAVTLAPSDIVVDVLNRRVTVSVQRAVGGSPINTFFAGALGISKMGTEAKAIAEASTQAVGTRCVKPIYIPNTALSSLGSVSAACSASPKQIIFDPATGKVTAWASSKLGSQVTIHPPSPSGALEPSQYYSLDFGTGGSTYRCTWGNCLNDPSCSANISVLKCGQKYPVETGRMVGPTKQGVDDLIGNPPASTFQALDQYKNNSTGAISDDSRALVAAPVWDDCPPNTINPGTQGQQAKVAGFLKVFVDQVSGGGDVTAHLVGEIECDGNASNTSSTGPFAIPVRLVHVP